MNYDNGTFTKFPNYILEKIMRSKLNGTQYAIVLTVLRYTEGFHRGDHELAVSFIAGATKLNSVNINRQINKLVEMNVLLKIKEANKRDGRYLAVNKNIDEWLVDRK